MIFGNIIPEISGTKFQNILEFQNRILEISGLWVKNRSLIDLKFWNSRTFFIVEIEKKTNHLHTETITRNFGGYSRFFKYLIKSAALKVRLILSAH